MNKTIEYYNQNADKFFRNTIDADMSELRKKFMGYLPQNGVILDAGCGSGRDSKVFIEHGYKVVAIDASEKLCNLASEYIGQQVYNITFEDIDYKGEFDGIWACASLLHVTMSELPNIMKKLNKALKKKGVLYSSFKKGEGERINDNRIFSDFVENKAIKLFKDADFKVLECFTTNDVREDRAEDCWVNIFADKR